MSHAVRLLLISALLNLVAGCKGTDGLGPAWFSPNERQHSVQDVVHVLTAPEPGESVVHLTNSLLISDERFAQVLYNELRKARPRQVRIFNLMAPRPILFLNADRRVVGAYEYYPGAVPEYVLRPCQVRSTSEVIELNAYFPGADMTKALVLTNFGSLVKPYFDLWPHAGESGTKPKQADDR